MKPRTLFFILLFITTCFFIFPYFQTMDAPAHDGSTVIGFPLTVYNFGGGMCAWDGPSGGGKGQCPAETWELTNTLRLLIDLIFITGISFIVSYGYYRFRRNKL